MPASSPAPARGGLESVVAGRTSIARIDGQKGLLSYRGYDAAELSRQSGFEEVAHLLWHGELPSSSELNDLRARLAENRDPPAELQRWLGELPRRAHPMEILRTATSVLGMYQGTVSAAGVDPSQRADD